MADQTDGPGEPARVGRLPDLVTAALAFVLWRVFFPGLMSTDSIIQYGQALTGRYNDWQPPLMAIVLKIVLASGGAIGILMLGQCVAGVFGIRALAAAVLNFLYGDRLPPSRVAWISVWVLALLLLPVTPLAFFLMTFWKDAWALVLLLWIGALILDLYRTGPRPKPVLLLVILATTLGLIRHNAVFVLPLISWALWAGLRKWRFAKPAAAALAAAPLALYLIANPLIDLVFGVEKLHPDSQILALDLVGLCAEDRAVCARLPWTQSNIPDERDLVHYRPGDIGFIAWDEPRHVDPALRGDYPRLRSEYLQAAREFPLLLAKVKWEAFKTQLGIDQTYYFFHDSIVDNPYGLALNSRFVPVRRLVSLAAGSIAIHPLLRWISGVHLVWIVVNVLWLAGLLAVSIRRREPKHRFLACLLLVPLGYYLSYLLATPIHDFRFMAPATLMVQCVTLSWLIGGLAQKPTGRAPSLSRVSA